MKKTIIIALGIMLFAIIGIGTIYACIGMMGHGGMVMGSEENHHQTMPPGHQGSEGDMPGHISPAMGSHSGHQHGNPIQGSSVTEAQAKSLVEKYLGSTRNPNLMIGNISENSSYFEAEITTRDGSLVDRIRVDKSTGTLRSVYSD